MRISDLRRSAAKAHRELGRPGLSVWGAEGMSAAQVLSHVGSQFPYRIVRVSTAGAVRGGGFQVEATGPEMHHTIWLPHRYDDDTLREVVQFFGPPTRRENA